MARTIVLVHGAWHGAWCWERQVAALAERGLAAVAVDLPGHGASRLPLGDLYGDAAHVARVLDGIDGEVLLVGHSYGGGVITEAAASASNVAHLVYLCAYCVEEGSSLRDEARRSPTPADLNAAMRPQADGTLLLDPTIAAPALYGDCSEADIAAALVRLGPQPMATLGQPIRTATWRTIPSTYVVCTEDRSITVDAQRVMAARCRHVVELDASHSPFLSRPDAVADILEPLAREAS
jgi:pimeloyl-ACP methyl ester carboxylesterase